MITEATPQQKAAVIGFWRIGASEDNDGDGTPQTPPQPVYVDHSKEMPWLNINDERLIELNIFN